MFHLHSCICACNNSSCLHVVVISFVRLQPSNHRSASSSSSSLLKRAPRTINDACCCCCCCSTPRWCWRRSSRASEAPSARRCHRPTASAPTAQGGSEASHGLHGLTPSELMSFYINTVHDPGDRVVLLHVLPGVVTEAIADPPAQFDLFDASAPPLHWVPQEFAQWCVQTKQRSFSFFSCC